MRGINWWKLHICELNLEDVSTKLESIMKQEKISSNDYAELKWIKGNVDRALKHTKIAASEAYYNKYKNRRNKEERL